MVRLGLMLITTFWCSANSVPLTLYKYGPDAFIMNKLSQLLRKTGTILRGPLNLPDIPPDDALHVDYIVQPPAIEEYNYYLPAFDNYEYDVKPLTSKTVRTEMMPPKLTQEPNYYLRKSNKYPKKFSSQLKHVNIKPVVEDNIESKESAEEIKEDGKITFTDDYFSGSVNVPNLIAGSTDSTEYNNNYSSKVTRKNVLPPEFEEHRDDDARIEYQVHGNDGPKSYKFGFDTGKGEDRLFRFEERDSNGDVKGEYGYKDSNGKTIIVRYTSTAEKGFQVETIC